MRSVVIIPARYESSRFPGKPLVKLLGKPMIIWVAELSALAVGQDNVYVATDDERISKIVTNAGFNIVMTSKRCLTGTDRVAEAASKIKSDIYVNVQGDEPTINPKDISNIIKAKKLHFDEVINGYCAISKDENPFNTNIPKVIFNEDNQMIYMSRQAIPGTKDTKKRSINYFKQVCIYAFTLDELNQYVGYGRKSYLEKYEDIEIIRFLEWGKKIRMVKTEPGSLAVDTLEDVKIVEDRLSNLHDV
jgi:3-deoxy-manno-octulosonate cytidylyltransferase (CMP-KDO synthetase)